MKKTLGYIQRFSLLECPDCIEDSVKSPVTMPTAADVVVLSSTPDHNSTRTPQQKSYNPEKLNGLSPQFDSPASLPSPSELFRKLQGSPNVTPQGTEKKVQKKTSKRAADKLVSDGNTTEDKPKRGRRKITDQLQTVLTHVEPAALESKVNSKKAPKTRTKRTDSGNKRGGSRNRTLTGRVFKASSADPQRSDTRKPSFSKSSSQGGAAKDLDWETSGLQLEEATRRRLDWTPTKDTGKQAVDLESDGDAGGDQKSGPAQNFSNLLAGYGFIGTMSPQPNVQENEDGSGPTKRRRIDVRSLNAKIPATSTDVLQLMDSRVLGGSRTNVNDKLSVEKDAGSRAKKQNKKFTTLTARVTARYAPGYTEDGGLYTTEDSSGNENAGRKQKSRAKTKQQEPEFIVLSPEAAVKSLEDQDLMFGTCSQLEREDSPTTLRDMQTAIKESEKCMDLDPLPSTSRTSSGSMISRFTGPRNLWSEAFRGLDGALAQAEILDLVDDYDISKISPRVDREKCEAQRWEKTPKEIGEQSNDTFEKEVHESETNSGKLSQVVDDGENEQEGIASVEESRPQMPQFSGLTDAELSKQIAGYGFKAVRGRQKMIDLLQKCWESKHGTNTTFSENRHQTSLDGAALTKPPEAGKGGKATDTVNKASGSKFKSKSKSAANSTAADGASTKPPARRRQGSSRPTSSSSQKPTEVHSSQQEQKPPSQQKFSFADVEEIEDSEDEAIPSPNQLLSRYFTDSKSSSQLLAVSPTPSPTRRATSKPQSGVMTASKFTDGEDDSLPDLATQITKAVRAQPNMSSSAGGRKCPSWHEKILMYDPIVLEDFTTWLNTEGLGLVTEDREASAGLVREWCESKGICCCYRNKS